MYGLLYNLLQYIGLSSRAADEEAESPKYVSITKYSELQVPVKCNGSYTNTYQKKNYHFYFDQTITQPSQNLK